MKLFDIIFGKKEDVKRVHQYAENLAYGYEENLYPALYELYKYDSKGNMIFSRVSNSERGYEIIKLYNDLGEVIYTQVHNSKK